jgi:hypothetical protein
VDNSYYAAVGIFLSLAFGFLITQLRREYYWLRSIGGFDAFYLEDEDA